MFILLFVHMVITIDTAFSPNLSSWSDLFLQVEIWFDHSLGRFMDGSDEETAHLKPIQISIHMY